MVAARRSTFDDAAWQSSARRGIHLAIRSGTTAVADIVTDPAVMPTLARSGLAGTAYLEGLFMDAPGWEQKGQSFADLLVHPGGPNAVGVSPHTLYTIGTERLLRPAGPRQVSRDAHAHPPRRVRGRVGVRAHRHRPVRRLRPALRHELRADRYGRRRVADPAPARPRRPGQRRPRRARRARRRRATGRCCARPAPTSRCACGPTPSSRPACRRSRPTSRGQLHRDRHRLAGQQPQPRPARGGSGDPAGRARPGVRRAATSTAGCSRR